MALRVAELAPGLWRWTAPHPDWTPATLVEDGWDRDVGCVYWEAPDTICLVDPLVPGDPEQREWFWRHLDADVERAGLPVAVFLTVFWHERSAAEAAARYSAEVWAHEDGLDRLQVPSQRPFTLRDELPAGLQAVEVARKGEVVYLVPSSPAALVAGDVLLGDGTGGVRFCADGWFADPEGPAQARAALRPLLERQLGLLLVSHGEPVVDGASEALARALAA